jgi:hypothetical protein
VLELDGRPVAEGRFREDELVARLRGATGRG